MLQTMLTIPYERTMHARWLVGLDLGQAQDFSALTVIEPTGDAKHPVHDVRHIERLPLGTTYPAVVAHTAAVVAGLRQVRPLRPVLLAIDYTGVGRPVFDMFAAEKKAGRLPVKQLVPITITGADMVTEDGKGGYRVPKRDLASVVQVLLQSERLRIAETLPMARELTTELTGFRVKISLTGHDSYGAGEDWRSAPHDDLVLSLAVACWLQKRATDRSVRGFGGR